MQEPTYRNTFVILIRRSRTDRQRVAGSSDYRELDGREGMRRKLYAQQAAIRPGRDERPAWSSPSASRMSQVRGLPDEWATVAVLV